jgi:hypothetical protein
LALTALEFLRKTLEVEDDDDAAAADPTTLFEPCCRPGGARRCFAVEADDVESWL